MTSVIEQDLSELGREIAERQRLIEDQLVLIEVLERDGHDVLGQEIALQQERSRLAVQIARQFELLQERLPT